MATPMSRSMELDFDPRRPLASFGDAVDEELFIRSYADEGMSSPMAALRHQGNSQRMGASLSPPPPKTAATRLASSAGGSGGSFCSSPRVDNKVTSRPPAWCDRKASSGSKTHTPPRGSSCTVFRRSSNGSVTPPVLGQRTPQAQASFDGDSNGSGGVKGDVSLYIRLRPGVDEEICVHAEGRNGVRLKQTQPFRQEGDVLYRCDHTFSPDASQEEVYQHAVTPICDAVIRGYNGAVIAYGQTGSGKTHTMIGNAKGARGVAPQAVAELFEALEKRQNWTVEVSVLEIYNERVRDLLAVTPGVTHVDIHETCSNDGNLSFRCPDATTWKAPTPDDALAALTEGMRRRETARTDMNHNSSRSHLIFTLCATQSDNDMGATIRGRLHLVDLAGSERLKRSMSSDRSFRSGNLTPRSPRDQRREAGEINKSLSQLALVIQRLTNPSFSSLQYVPYRDSMLTRLLAECFGGNSKTCVIITCSTSAKDREETRSSLEFGKRAKLVKNKAEINLEITHESTPVLQALLQKEMQRELTELQQERDDLQQERHDLRQERDTLVAEKNFLQSKLSATQELMKEAASEVIFLQDRRIEELQQHEDEKGLLQQRNAEALATTKESQVALAGQIAELQNMRLTLHGQLVKAATEIAHLRQEHLDTAKEHEKEVRNLRDHALDEAKQLEIAREQAATSRAECAAVWSRWMEEASRLENEKAELLAKAEKEKESLRNQLAEAVAQLTQQHDERMQQRLGSAAIVTEAAAAARLAEEDGKVISAQSSEKLSGLRRQMETAIAETAKADELRKARIAEVETEQSARKNKWRQAIETVRASENAITPGEIHGLEGDPIVDGRWVQCPPSPKCLSWDHLDSQPPTFEAPHKLVGQGNQPIVTKESASSAEPFPGLRP